jgi:predicted kinase
VVRKGLVGRISRDIVPLDRDIYRPTMTEKTYSKMVQQAEKHIIQGRGAIVDASFGRRALREKMIRLAERYKTPLLVIHCSAPETTTARRLRDRATQGVDISDGRWEIYVAQKAAYEPMDELPSAAIFELDTSAPVADLVAACERFLRARLYTERVSSSG